MKISLVCNGFPEEIGSDKVKEFKNKLIEDYYGIKCIHGALYNPHSQGVVERFYQTIKDLLIRICAEENKSLNLSENLEIALKKYNNLIHNSTK